MHCALRRANSDFRKGVYGGRDSLSCKEQSSLITSIEDFESPYITWRNSDSRCAVVKFLSLEPDGHWRIVALPLQYTDQINMESLHLSYLPPISPFKFNRQNVRKGPPHDVVYSFKSLTNRRFSDSSKRHQSRNKALVKAIKWNVSRKCQKPLTSGDSSVIIPHNSNAIRSSDVVSHRKVESIVKRSSRKKSRKKGKQSMKVLCDVHSTDPEVICEEYGNVSSVSETGGNNEGDVSTLSSTAPEFLSLDPKNSETAWTVTSSNDELATVSNLESQFVPTGYSEMQESFILDSISTGSNSDGSMNLGNDENHADQERNNTDLSAPLDSDSRKVYFTRQSSINDFVNNYNHAEGDRQGTHCCSSTTDMKYVVPNKRSKQTKLGHRSANVPKSVGNMRTVKENIHSVWQKVQKKDVDDCAGELTKTSPIDTRLDLPLREAPMINTTCKAVDTDVLSKNENRKQQKHKVSKKLKRRNAPALKREHTCYSRKGSHASLAGSDELRVDQSDIPDIMTQASKIECMKSESVQSMQLCPNEIVHLKNLCRTVSGMHDQKVGDEDDSTLKTCHYWKEPNPCQMQYPPYDTASREVQRHISLAETSKQNHSRSGSLTQKWIPIGMKDSELSSSTESDSSSLEHSDEGGSKRWIITDTININVVSETAVESMTQESVRETCFSDDTEIRIPISDAVEEMTSKQLDASNVVNSSLVSGGLNSCEPYSNRILEAVNESCRAQLASENVQMITGHPIAEIERVLYCSSPVIHQSPSCINCCTCRSRNLNEQAGGVSLCRHETRNITLGCIWDWYEKNGCYGMEIRGGDLGYSERLGADRFAFRAYFVPYLSGIQLFKNDRSSVAGDINSGIYSDEMLETCWSGEGDAVNLPLVDELAVPEVRSADNKDFRELQLLLEYFEYERPQHRRPLFEKIKELVKGNGNSHSKLYGDPTILDSTNLNDLHPRSWYSVAWYPIYRIPDGNFCASFLTYHSLGCLVRRRANLESHSMDDSIISPVVGLQSYNAQRECWFQLRPSEAEQTIETNLNPCGVLEERLRTLEETASLMARAVVSKGNETSVNRHPDYEFFLSRRIIMRNLLFGRSLATLKSLLAITYLRYRYILRSSLSKEKRDKVRRGSLHRIRTRGLTRLGNPRRRYRFGELA